MACTVDLMKLPIQDIKIGHWTDTEAKTGCTVIRFPKSVVASVKFEVGHPPPESSSYWLPNEQLKILML